MAEIVTRSYICDRCGVSLGDHPCPGARVVTLSASVSYLLEPGRSVEWNHLCAPCGTDVLAFIEGSSGNPQAGPIIIKEPGER